MVVRLKVVSGCGTRWCAQDQGEGFLLELQRLLETKVVEQQVKVILNPVRQKRLLPCRERANCNVPQDMDLASWPEISNDSATVLVVLPWPQLACKGEVC